ncbi:RloB family protein [Spirosoma rhododendri]|uniref:RloB domain-containing protein n=1 Tax=Spirosoma rhododendri TaxID=2728024 RepID=A0A7L5DUK2_9BACT|nr:RloB family protein [Spirosoma rhododendri]QJD80278.1 RloB domain-containing protein [Spirosoma rhododendri]
MARVAKIDNADKKRFERQETKRKQDTRPKRRFYLIVCEGIKTEPHYFNGLKRKLPPHVLELVDLDAQGTGLNTLGLVKKSLSIKEEFENQGRVVDEVWAVFDRDSFPNHHFDNAIAKANELNVYCAWSNEAFELWFLLHFQDFQNAMRRQNYRSKLERELSQRMGTPFSYEKNSESVFDLLSKHGDEEQAIKRAKKLVAQFIGRTDYANHNPCTTVYTLIEKLRPQIR